MVRENGFVLLDQRVLFKANFKKPTSVKVDGDGNLVISDSSNHRIQVMGIKGNFIRTFGTKGATDSQLNNPKGIDIDGGVELLLRNGK